MPPGYTEEFCLALALRVLIVCLLCSPAFAQQRVDLYQADMLVADQSQRERNQATVDGLAEVVVRASGQPLVLQNPELMKAFDRASDFLVEWRYESTDETLTIDGREQPARRLVLRYSGNAIEKLLRDLRLPIWPANRPSMLVWLIVDDKDGRTRVSSSAADSAAADVLQHTEASAKRRGIPIIKPLMDLEDQVALSADALWSMDQQAIRRASERYNADGILVGRLTETSRGEWRAGWLLLHQGRSEVFDGGGVELADVVAEGIDQIANHFSQLYGITPSDGSSEAMAFQMDGISDFASYMQVMDYLQSLAVVRRYDLVAVRGDSMLLYIYLEGDIDRLRGALSLDGRLVSQPDLSMATTPLGDPGNPIRYRWK